MKKRLRKLGDAARARGEKDNQAAVIVGMEGIVHSGKAYAADERKQKRHVQYIVKRSGKEGGSG